MTNYVMLNNIEHFDVKVSDQNYIDPLDQKAAILTFPTEFLNIQKEYPILLSKDESTGEIQAVALLGIQRDENLFLKSNEDGTVRWLANYIPALIAKGPFITGLQEQSTGEQEAMVYIDVNSKKISKEKGKPLFLPHGGNSPYLEYITKILQTIQDGKTVGDAMFTTFEKLNLLEPLTVNIDLINGDKHQLRGYYTINEEALSNLSGENLQRLNKLGYLQGAFLILASLSNLEKLIKIKNSNLQIA
jgi:hypothetical protein